MTAIEQSGREKRPFSFFWLAYGQVAAMLGAFSLLVFLTHFFDLGLKGVVRDAFEVWTGYVRPFVGHPIQWLVNLLPEAWRFEVPSIVKDYFAVGLVTAFSMARADIMIGRRGPSRLQTIRSLAFSVIIWPITPIVVVEFLIEAIGANTVKSDSIYAAISFAPLAYLGLLFAANAWLT